MSQDPNHRLRAGEMIMTCLRNTQLYSMSSSHLFTMKELMCAHGWPAIMGLSNFSAPKWMRSIGEPGCVSINVARGLLGNSMHLAAMGAFFCYCMAHTVRNRFFDGSTDKLTSLSLSGSEND